MLYIYILYIDPIREKFLSKICSCLQLLFFKLGLTDDRYKDDLVDRPATELLHDVKKDRHFTD